VNSFGFGGTNSHAIIDDAFYYIQERALRVNHCMKLPLTNGFSNGQNRNAVTNGFGLESSSAGSKSRLLIWSAADEHTLRLMMNQYMSYYEDRVHGSEQQTDKLAFTLSEKRSKMLWRCFALADPLSADRTLKFSKPFRSGPQTGIAFVFTGQGAQYADMGIGLLRYPIFRETLTRADKCLANLGCTWSLFGAYKSTDGHRLR
jgi:acyl transferase domain-containing protein